jgi:hypothetical protein
MKKAPIIFALLCTLILFSAVTLHSANASITNYNWINTLLHNSYDEFYGTSVTGYEENTTANLVVNVYNDFFGFQVNVSKVAVGFDWGINYTSSDVSLDQPYAIPPYQSHVFSVSFEIPSVLMASNFVTHSYIIYVEHVNSTTGNKGLVSFWTRSDDGFAVFSSDQANARSLRDQINAYPSTTSINGIPILTANARELIVQSGIAETMASNYYGQGDFTNAKNYYADSLNDLQQAFSNDTDMMSSIESSLANLLNSGGNLLMFQGYAWLLIAIGFLLMGVGVLVYLVRKRPEQTMMRQTSQMPAPPPA